MAIRIYGMITTPRGLPDAGSKSRAGWKKQRGVRESNGEVIYKMRVSRY